MSARVVFLDVDGVICLSSGEFEASACGQLARLIEHSGARIVISSTWRYTDDASDLLRAHLATQGLRAHDETPFVDDSAARFAATDPAMLRTHEPAAVTRAYEIFRWLLAAPDVQSWVALDDLDLPIGVHLIRTTWECGLTSSHVDRAMEILAQPAPPPHELFRFTPPDTAAGI
ncbi:MAG: HAD domain-containing protein [Planctomycetota bacterium]